MDQNRIRFDGESAGDYSGYPVSLLDGLTLAIGADCIDGNGSNSGHVRVYQYKSEPDQWKQMGSDIDGEPVYDVSGYSISISSDELKVAIGSIYNDGNGGNSGHV